MRDLTHINVTGAPEQVLSKRQTDAFDAAAHRRPAQADVEQPPAEPDGEEDA